MAQALSNLFMIGAAAFALYAFAKWYLNEIDRTAKLIRKDMEEATSRCIGQLVDGAEQASKRTLDHFAKIAKDPEVQRTTENVAVAGAAVIVLTALLKKAVK